MKTIFAALALVIVSVTILHAGGSPGGGQVPEPSSLILLISGVGGLVFWLRKRR
jgi:hypothetical protein